MALLLASSTASAQALVISEFRTRGPNGDNDEFVEIYNNSDTPHTVAASDGSSGYAVVASDGIMRFVIPNGTVIPARGHYLGVNSVGYSLSTYPAGNGTTATGNSTFTTDIPDNAGIALFKTSNAASFNLANRLDAVGSTKEANPLYKEGAGYPELTPFSIEYSFYRRFPGTGTIVPGACLAALGTAPQDTNDNAADFLFVDTNGTSAGAGQRLGAPGPQNLSSPVKSLAASATALVRLASSVGVADPPNVVRNTTSDPGQNSTFGTIAIRRRFTNESGAPLTRLRFRVIGISTFPAPSGTADLRTRTSSNVVVALPNGGGNVTVRGTTVEQPPSQPNGGAFNSTFSVPSVTAGTPLGPGESIALQFLLGVQQGGKYQFFVEVEALPTTTRTVWGMLGDTTDPTAATDCAIQATTTTLASSAASVLEGDAVTLTATVAPPAATTGEVTFLDGPAELATVPLAGGKAEYTTDALAIGSHSITAHYAGADLFEPSTSTPIVIEVGPRPAPDAGSGDADSKDGADAGTNAPTEPGAEDSAAPSADDAGCGCRVGREANVGALSVLGLGLVAALLGRRREGGEPSDGGRER